MGRKSDAIKETEGGGKEGKRTDEGSRGKERILEGKKESRKVEGK